MKESIETVRSMVQVDLFGLMGQLMMEHSRKTI